MVNKNSFKRFAAGVASVVIAAACAASAVSVSREPVSTVSAASDSNYAEALALSLYMFDANECGSDVSENPLTWRGDCHTYDGKAAISSAVNFDSSYKSLVDPDGDGYVDLDGGYHDAGDHIKFAQTIGFGASSLALSYYLNDGAYEKAGCTDHLVEILKKASDYLMKSTFLDSSGKVATVCYMVSDESDHNYWTSPETQTYARPTYWLTSSKNNSSVCGQMACALAGTAYVLKNSDPSYASECLKYAKALYEFGSSYTGLEATGMSSMYGTSSYKDDLLMAQAWLYVNDAASKPTVVPSNGQYDGEYDYYIYSWDKVYQGYAALMYKATGNSSFLTELKMEYNNQGGLSTSSYSTKWGWGNSRCNCALQMDALILAEGDSSSSYAQGAKYQMDYLLGNNSYGYSFLVGYGDSYPTHYHHRASNPGTGNPQDNTACKYVCYGALLGGPDDAGYKDEQNSYTYTEPALDYNGCFALACAGLVNLYGGNASAIDSVISSASEINANYVFNAGGSSVTTTTTTTTTTKTTTTTTTTKSSTTSKSTTSKTTTTTTTTKSQSGGKSLSYTEGSETGEDGSDYKYVEIVPGDSKTITVTYKVTSSDTESSGAFGTWTGTWDQVDFKEDVSNGTVTVTYEVPSNVGSTVKCSVYWPGVDSVEFVSVVGDASGSSGSTTTTTTQGGTSSDGTYTLNLDQDVDYGALPATDRMIGWDWADFGIPAGATITSVDVNISSPLTIGTWQGAFGTSTSVDPDYWAQSEDMELKIDGTSGTITWNIDPSVSSVIQTQYGGQLKFGIWWIDCEIFTIDSIVVHTGSSGSTTTATSTTTTSRTTTTSKTTTTTTTTTNQGQTNPTNLPSVTKYGDVNVDNKVNVADVILLNKYIVGADTITDQGLANAACYDDSKIDINDSAQIMNVVVMTLSDSDLPVKP